MKYTLYAGGVHKELEAMENRFWVKVTILTHYEMQIIDETNKSDKTPQYNAIRNILKEENELVADQRNYPCSYLYMFRSTLLDKNQQNYFGV